MRALLATLAGLAMLGIASTAILLDMPCPVDSQFLSNVGRVGLAKTDRTKKGKNDSHYKKPKRQLFSIGRSEGQPDTF
jgi:hypothetical protein